MGEDDSEKTPTNEVAEVAEEKENHSPNFKLPKSKIKRSKWKSEPQDTIFNKLDQKTILQACENTLSKENSPGSENSLPVPGNSNKSPEVVSTPKHRSRNNSETNTPISSPIKRLLEDSEDTGADSDVDSTATE